MKKMTFAEALKKALAGEHIKREVWDQGTYGFFLNGVLHIRVEFKVHQWILSESDVLATDWEVYD